MWDDHAEGSIEPSDGGLSPSLKLMKGWSGFILMEENADR
jgi:hypothetical protein